MSDAQPCGADLLRQAHAALNIGDVFLADVLLGRARAAGCDEAPLLSLTAGVHMRKREFGRALEYLSAASRLRPLDFAVSFNQGLCFYELGRFEDAIQAHRRSLKLNMNHAKGWMKLGASHLVLQHWADALACQERAVALDPNDAELRCSLATTMSLLSDDENAEAEYRRSLELQPGKHEPEIALGFILLRQGKWVEGWQRFEARWQLRPFGAPWDWKPTRPWQGEASNMAGRDVVLRSEMGFGDTLHFIRYLPLVAAIAKSVTMVTPPPLRSLIETSYGDLATVTTEIAFRQDGAIDVPLMSLPRVFNTTLESVPMPAVFTVKPRKIGARIGVCWQGGPRPEDAIAHADDQRRSIPEAQFRPIIDACDGSAMSLQWEDLQGWGCKDWRDTAEIVAGLDLVITVDTAMAHLAGSLGIETWCLLRAGGCWRWLLHGDTTVWYPLMRLYRQVALGEWGPTITRVVDDLGQWRHAKASQAI